MSDWADNDNAEVGSPMVAATRVVVAVAVSIVSTATDAS